MSENRSLSLDKGVTAKHSNTIFILRLRGGSSTTTQPPRPINIDYAMLLVNTLGLAAAAAQLGVVPSKFISASGVVANIFLIVRFSKALRLADLVGDNRSQNEPIISCWGPMKWLP
ncbi:hypothetical protein LENED_001824 [Lentinula edodes]|uniref:Uncharacterized protein n=1 Tax=Lentinula edodes TaxID=5353 RepID=A0A1Q3DZJ0_LENED|nr:hypothetical protein LENED_001824 [Lentinula edodes]